MKEGSPPLHSRVLQHLIYHRLRPTVVPLTNACIVLFYDAKATLPRVICHRCVEVLMARPNRLSRCRIKRKRKNPENRSLLPNFSQHRTRTSKEISLGVLATQRCGHQNAGTRNSSVMTRAQEHPNRPVISVFQSDDRVEE